MGPTASLIAMEEEKSLPVSEIKAVTCMSVTVAVYGSLPCNGLLVVSFAVVA
jgi:hypothetical protein